MNNYYQTAPRISENNAHYSSVGSSDYVAEVAYYNPEKGKTAIG